MSTLKNSLCWIFILTLCISGCKSSLDTVELNSPDNLYTFHLDLKDAFAYAVSWNGVSIIEKSALGFELNDGTILQEAVTVVKIEKTSNNTSWKPVYGEQSEYVDHYNEMVVYLKSIALEGEFALRVRAYNEGVAFRYEITSEADLHIDEELTEFTYPADVNAWVSAAAQSEIKRQKLSALSFIAERPLLAELSDSVFTAIGEAALVDFARMKFEKHGAKSNTLMASLEKGDKNQYSVFVPKGGYNLPWRYVMAGKNTAQILQNNFLLLNLNEANKIADASFIKPGKVLREVTLTTQGGIACVDFAVKHNLQFVEFDAGWYGNEYDDASDATTVTVDPNRSPGPLDLPKVIDYAKERGIGIILYVNRRALEKQLDEVLPLVKSWGVAGIKYGFVQVGPQKWTSWLHEAVRKAAEHELMVDVHDEYRPTGYSRTYPNLMTQEGIRGDEESTPNDGVITTIFTRMIAGAGDQTNCYFASRVTEKMGSHASQMAKVICIYSPWQFLYWYDRPEGAPFKTGGAGGADGLIPEIEDLQFFDDVPTVWDDTKVLEGYPGKYVSIARKHGEKWYLGAIAGTEEYSLSLKLDFLDENTAYKATVFSDDKSLNTHTNLLIEDMEVDSNTVFERNVFQQNGLAVIFSPLE
ncbi:glycoside hydrolase family 97 protein [Lunatimonas salinarum]|uniref:glycoside hydrolase family 97 protein n=1 Tax=Lunatimonas salinarum TaxID=1774590 RepID=UPI001ADF3A99|nr:glycoside hydrolase family 97 protein [Lunatimonas salinarum]